MADDSEAHVSLPQRSSRWSAGRIITMILAAVFAVPGFLYLRAAFSAHAKYKNLGEIHSTEFVVDLSKPGVFQDQYNQHSSVSHGESIKLIVPAGTFDPESITNNFSKLKLTYTFFDEKGKTISTKSVLGSELDLREHQFSKGEIPLINLIPFPAGEYLFVFEVVYGIGSLRYVPQKLVGEHVLCGLEFQIPFIMGFVGVCCLMVALFLVWAGNLAVMLTKVFNIFRTVLSELAGLFR